MTLTFLALLGGALLLLSLAGVALLSIYYGAKHWPQGRK